jgi:hypothetical protein
VELLLERPNDVITVAWLVLEEVEDNELEIASRELTSAVMRAEAATEVTEWPTSRPTVTKAMVEMPESSAPPGAASEAEWCVMSMTRHWILLVNLSDDISR